MENVSPIQNTPSGYACHPSCEEGNLRSLHAQIRVLPMGREQELLARRASTLDRQIDALVYALYGLTPEEIALIES